MITFLPVPSFDETAKILDYKRLGKQRIEALMILRILDGSTKSLNSLPHSRWVNHPAVRMWVGHETSLQIYTLAMISEWIGRGYKNTISEEVESFEFESMTTPPWIGCEEFHISHQSNLVRKVPERYREYFPNVPEDLPYFWPLPD